MGVPRGQAAEDLQGLDVRTDVFFVDYSSVGFVRNTILRNREYGKS